MIIIYTSFPNKTEAKKVGNALIKEKIVACVNMWSVDSIYWWEGKIQKEGEWVMLCKTREALAKRVEKRIHELTSYDLSVIEQWEVKRAYKGVLKWINEVTR
jgi:periplasmic divalent cation tolerance protein